MSGDAAKPVLKLYTDKHMPKAVATQLRLRGFDVVRCEEVGMGDASDEAHLIYATGEGRVVITGDADFLRLHDKWQAVGKTHGGIMHLAAHIQGPAGTGVIVRTVLMYHELIDGGAGTIHEDIANHVIFVT